MGERYNHVLLKYGRKLETSRKYTFTHEIKIESPSAMIAVINTTGIAHNIFHVIGNPMTVRITKKTNIVGRNRMRATIAADIGSMILGNAVFKISFCPFTTEREPPAKVFDTK